MILYKHHNIYVLTITIIFMKSIKEHVGFVVGEGYNERPAAAIKKIVAAEAAGIRQIWMNQVQLST